MRKGIRITDLMALREAEISLAEMDGMQAGYHDFRHALIRPKTVCPHKWEADQALTIAWQTGWINGANAAMRFGALLDRHERIKSAGSIG